MHFFLKFIFFTYMLILISCVNSSNKKISDTNEKYYKIESIKEVDIYNLSNFGIFSFKKYII